MKPQRRSVDPKVAIVLPTAEGGGAERSMIRLANGLYLSGVGVDLVLGVAEGEYLDEIGDGVNVVDLRSRRMSGAIPDLVRYLRSERPISLVATLPHANVAVYIASKLARSQTRIYLREASTPSSITEDRFGVHGRVTFGLLRAAYRGVHGVVAVSNGAAADLHAYHGVPADRIHTIANPVVDEELFRLAAEAIPFRPFDTDSPHLILAAGRLKADKGFDTLLRAFASVRSRVDAQLLLLGEGPERVSLEATAEELGIASHVRLPGFVSNPFAFMSRAAVFVLSSRLEGLPGVLIQAMACGCPVVSTDCKSGPDEILDDGRYGMLVPVGDEAAMAAAILRTLEGHTDVESAKRRALDYSLEASVEAYRRLLL